MSDCGRRPVIGFVGLGNMGAPMAANIAAAGFELIGFDAAGTDGRLPDGASAAASIERASCERADTVLLSVPDGAVDAGDRRRRSQQHPTAGRRS